MTIEQVNTAPVPAIPPRDQFLTAVRTGDVERIQELMTNREQWLQFTHIFASDLLKAIFVAEHNGHNQIAEPALHGLNLNEIKEVLSRCSRGGPEDRVQVEGQVWIVHNHPTSLATLRVLLEHGATQNNNNDANSKLVCNAISYTNPETIDYLLAQGIRTNANEVAKIFTYTVLQEEWGAQTLAALCAHHIINTGEALFYAINNGSLNITRAFLNFQEVDVNAELPFEANLWLDCNRFSLNGFRLVGDYQDNANVPE